MRNAIEKNKLEQALAGLAIEYIIKNKPDALALYIQAFDETQYDILKEMGFRDHE